MSAALFRSLFLEEFKTRAAQTPSFGQFWHAGGPPWTHIMVHSEDRSSVLERTLQRWADSTLGADQISMRHWYTIDLMAVTPPHRDVEYWDTRPVALIEHENRKDIETELWKLAHWRAPLKVLVFYRFGESWLDAKFETARRIIESAQITCPEDGAEYLLLAGCNIDAHVSWREQSWRCGDDWRTATHETGVHVGA